MNIHRHATPIRRCRPGLLALAALPVTLVAVIGLMLRVGTANHSKDLKFSVLNRAQRARLGLIGALILLPVILIASPANAATGGTDAPQATHVAPVSGKTGPARGKHLTHKRVSPDIPGGTGSSSTYNSANWDGYAVLNSSGTNTNSFNHVSAQWTVPTITCDLSNPDTEWVGFWVGLDGWLNNNVEQGGTEALCIHGVPSYRMWWEMYPYNYVQHGLSINPGDLIQASVTYVPSTSQFNIMVNDVTSNQMLIQNVACQSGQANCARSSAEVISEDIDGGADLDGLYYLPNYGTATFTNVSVTDVNGHTGSLNDPTWNSVAVTEVSSAGVTKQTVGPLSTDGTSFTTTWQHESGTPAATTSSLLSQGKPATASSTENAGTPASAAVDGNTGTRWSSAFSDPQWIYVDLGAHATISQVVLNWETAHATAFQLQVSDDATNWTSIYSTTTGPGGTQTLNVSGAGRYVRMYGTVRSNGYGYSLWEFQVFGSLDSSGGCGTTNVAQGKPATASSTENAGTPASAAVDGNAGTRWSSAFSDPQWIYVDLGAPVTICQIVLTWEGAYATAFQLQVSNDATNWTSIYSTTTGTGGTQTINANGTGRYVRMYGTARATGYGYSIWEFVVNTTTTTGGGGTNVALSKPATADSSCSANETPDKAFNGSVTGGTNDKWCSLSSNRWLQVDLGQTYQVKSFALRNAGAGGENAAWDTRDADVLVSTDGSTWSTAAQIRGNTANVTTVNLTSPVAARYVKLNVITPTNTTDPAARIYEFEVYA